VHPDALDEDCRRTTALDFVGELAALVKD